MTEIQDIAFAWHEIQSQADYVLQDNKFHHYQQDSHSAPLSNNGINCNISHNIEEYDGIFAMKHDSEIQRIDILLRDLQLEKSQLVM